MKVEGSRSRSQQGQIFDCIIAEVEASLSLFVDGVQ